jgi:IclR helix-turn-helix domain
MSDLTLAERRILLAMFRIHAAHETLGVDNTARLILACFLQVPGCWTATAISNYAHLPRTTVLRRLEGYLGEGLVERGSEGWSLSDTGVEISRKVSRQTAEIMRGMRVGFESDLVRKFKVPPMLSHGVDEEAALKISFPPLPEK